MTYKPLYSFSTTLKGKIIRFKSPFTVPNLSHLSGISKEHNEKLQLPAGALGMIYEVRGATLFVGFGHNLKLAPVKSSSPTSYAATAQIFIDDIHKLEIEN